MALFFKKKNHYSTEKGLKFDDRIKWSLEERLSWFSVALSLPLSLSQAVSRLLHQFKAQFKDKVMDNLLTHQRHFPYLLSLTSDLRTIVGRLRLDLIPKKLINVFICAPLLIKLIS